VSDLPSKILLLPNGTLPIVIGSLTDASRGTIVSARSDWLRDGDKAVPTGLPTDVYTLRAYTLGYYQEIVPEVWAQKGSSTGDSPLYLLSGAEIDVVWASRQN